MVNETSINVLTLNCWGIPYVSKNRIDRMNAIADELNTGLYDLVCLQEVWSIDDFKMFEKKTQSQLPYSHYFFSGVLGSGICILSRYPIKDVMFHKWPLNGYVHKIHHGDWFGGKGVGLCCVNVDGINVNVYIAHLHAEYNQENDEYCAHRILQAFDTAQFIRMTRGGADAVVLGGDLNTEPQNLAYKIIQGVAGLADACSIDFNNLGTNECANNSYTYMKQARDCPEGKRIDHIMYFGSRHYKVEVESFEHPFPKRVPNKEFSYSDHEAILARLKLTKGEYQVDEIDVRESLKEAINICNIALKDVNRQRIWYWILGCIIFIPLVALMGLDYTSYSIGTSIGINIARLILTAVLCYSLFMSTIWNRVETNALKAGCLGLDIHMMQLNSCLQKD